MRLRHELANHLDRARVVALAGSLHPGIEFREADAESLPFDAGAFDAVVSNFGVGHLPRPERAVAEFARVLARGGVTAVTWWKLSARNRVNGVFFDALSQAEASPPPDLPAGPAVFRFLDEAELLSLLSGAGLVDVAAVEARWMHSVPNAETWWRGGLGGLARASASILGQAPAMQGRIRAAFGRLVEPYAAVGGYRVPCAAKVASGKKPSLLLPDPG